MLCAGEGDRAARNTKQGVSSRCLQKKSTICVGRHDLVRVVGCSEHCYETIIRGLVKTTQTL